MDNKTKVLIIEDSPIIMEVHKAMVILLGYMPDCAADGAQARQLFQDNHYDIILSDLGLPDTDGAILAQWFRMTEQSQGRKKSTIIAITAFMLDEVTEQCIEVGMDGVYAKPIKPITLEMIFAKALNKPSSVCYLDNTLDIA